MRIILSNSGHYPDEYWELFASDVALLEKLEITYGYLDAAPKEQVEAILKRGRRLQTPVSITKYV
jgi:hypothetical protein